MKMSEKEILDKSREIIAEYALPNSSVDAGNLYWILGELVSLLESKSTSSECFCQSCKKKQDHATNLLKDREDQLTLLKAQNQVLMNAIKSCVGFEPFNSLVPHRLSEALTRVAEMEKKHDT